MTERSDDYSGAWIQGGTARIPAPGEPGGRPVVVDDTPPEIKEHLRTEFSTSWTTWRNSTETTIRPSPRPGRR